MSLDQRIEALEKESHRWMFSNTERYRQVTAEMVSLSRGARPGGQARAHRAHGNALRMDGKWEEALRSVRRALRLWRRAGDEVEWARTQTSLIPILAQLGENRRALTASRAGLAVFLRHDQSLPAARLLNNTGGIYLFTGQNREALRCFEQARELAAKAGDRALGARAELHAAMALQALGRHREALRRCATALRPSIKTSQTLHVARIQVVAAVSLFRLGRFGKALRRFAKARTLFEGESAARDVAECDLHICACYLELNRYGPALGRIEAFLEQPGRAWFETAWAWYYRGVSLAGLGRPEEARSSLVQAGRLFRRHGDRKGAARAGLEEAELLLRLGTSAAAGRLAARVQRDFSRRTSRLELARTAIVLAAASLVSGRLSRAEAEARRAWEIARHAHTPGLTFRALQLLGQVALQGDRLEESQRFLSAAVRLAEQMRATVQLPFRQTFLADKSAAYADLIWLHLAQGKVKVAHRLMEKAKSRALADQLAAAPAAREGAPGAAEERLRRELDAARWEYQQLTLPTQLGAVPVGGVRALPDVDLARRHWLEQRLGLLWDEWELRRVGTAGSALYKSKERPPRLKRGEAMVEYMVVRDRLIAFVSDHRGLRGWSNLGPIDAVVRTLELFQLNLDATLNLRHSAAALRGLTKNAVTLLQELYRRIWAPLSWLAGQERVLVVPHGPLHQVPFGALHDGERYLVERVEVVLAPSRTVWLRCVERTKHERYATDLVLGYNPGGELPFVEAEAKSVAQHLAAPLYLQEQASLAQVIEIGPCRVLHLAVHGQFRPDNPDFSALLLADGALTAADVTTLRLQASLVTLSACETGLSRVSGGEELTGLITAFLTAGSASVLASLWRVDDAATANLMIQVYQGLLSGLGRAAALREAQVTQIVQQKHPLYWAAFAVVGAGGPLPSFAYEGGVFA